MAATVRPDDHHVLMRRIGYSVALEPVPTKIPLLMHAYTQTGVLDRSVWHMLAKEWEMPSGLHERRKKRAEHFLDVVSALGFSTQNEQILSPAPPLEVAAVVGRILPDQQGVLDRIILLNQIIESDADIFLNVIASRGSEEMFDEMLNDVVEQKRMILMPLFMSGTLRDRLDRILDIARQTDVRGKRLARSPISRDLITKAIETRTRWAERLGILEHGEMTAVGSRLMSNVDRLCEVTPNGARILWPYDYELTALRLSPDQLAQKVPVPSVWGLISAVASGYLDHTAEPVSASQQKLVADIELLHSIFKELNPGKNALAAQMPVTVVNLSHPLLTLLRGEPLVNLPAALLDQRATKESPIVFMKRSGSEGTLLFR